MIPAEYFDIAGFVAFLILFFIGLSIKKVFKKRGLYIVLISLGGLVLEGYSLVSRFALN